jgi:hypothetical protein
MSCMWYIGHKLLCIKLLLPGSTEAICLSDFSYNPQLPDLVSLKLSFIPNAMARMQSTGLSHFKESTLPIPTVEVEVGLPF